MGLGVPESSRGPKREIGAYISGGSVWRYCLNKGIGSYLSKRRLSEDKVNFALGTCTESILRRNFRSVISDDTRYRKFATIKI